MAGSFRQFDHTGDVGVEAEAPDLDSLFMRCAEALFDVLSFAGDYGEEGLVPVEVRAPDLEALLVRWLGELLYLHDTARWVFIRFVPVITEEIGAGWVLKGTAHGEKFDPSRHRLKTELKAVTYHQAVVAREDGGTWRARVVFDI